MCEDKSGMWMHGETHFLAYSGTPLNRHPLAADTHNIFWKFQLSFHSLQYLGNPWIADTPLLHIMDSFHGPMCMQTILNDPDLADTRQTFQQDCQPSLLESNNLTLD